MKTGKSSAGTTRTAVTAPAAVTATAAAPKGAAKPVPRLTTLSHGAG